MKRNCILCKATGMDQRQPTQPIQSLSRGLSLLTAVADAGRPLSLAELNEIVPIDRSSVFRLANTLRMHGFLTQSPASKRYTLGPAVWQLSGQLRAANSLPQVARPHVVELAEQTGETAHLAIRQEDRSVFVDHELTEQAVGVSTRTGRSEPLHSTALGKALLADFDRKALVQLLGEGSLPADTPRTTTSIAALASQCRKAQRQGVAIDDEECHEGVRCIAASIRDSHGAVVAAIGISAPANRLPKRRFASVASHVRLQAAQISRKLGYVTAKPEGAE